MSVAQRHPETAHEMPSRTDFQEAPTGSLCAEARSHQSSLALQGAREFHVLEKGLFPEAADPCESGAVREHGLVAVDDVPVGRIDQPVQEVEYPPSGNEAGVEAAAAHARLREDAQDLRPPTDGEDGIGVTEDQHPAPCLAGAPVHLSSPPACRLHELHSSGDQAPRAVMAASVDYDHLHLGLGAPPARGCYGPNDERLFVERGYDYRDQL
jgi:hypothetical protein